MAQIAVLGDIHSNLTALEAVLKACQRRKITRFICLGDIVGYAAHPTECLELIRSLDCVTVLGNHDACVTMQ
jgi:predicted phosphodiesterase